MADKNSLFRTDVLRSKEALVERKSEIIKGFAVVTKGVTQDESRFLTSQPPAWQNNKRQNTSHGDESALTIPPRDALRQLIDGRRDVGWGAPQ